MPEISRFFGIVIGMFYDDHNPAHFHVRYGEHKAIIRIEDFSLRKGYLPSRAMGLVIEWASSHKQELIETGNVRARIKSWCTFILWNKFVSEELNT